MLYIKLFIEREKNTGQSAPECPFKHNQYQEDKMHSTAVLGRQRAKPRSKPDTVDQPVRTARTFVHHYNGRQYCSTETVLLMFTSSKPPSRRRCCKGKGKCLDTCYSATYMSKTRDQQRCTISEVAVDWLEPMVPQRIIWPRSARANGQLNQRCS